MSRTIERTIEIDASPAHVWGVLTDFPAHAQWNPFIQDISGDAVMGARLEVHIAPQGRRSMRFRPTITSAVPQRELAWFGSLGVRGIFDGAHSFVLRDLGGTRTSLTQAETFSGALVPLFGSGLEGTATGFEEMNQALKERCESSSMIDRTKPRHTNDESVRSPVAIVLAAGLLIVTIFQITLTLGAPFGAAALGGTNPGQLPADLRVVTGISSVLWAFATLLVLARGGRAVVQFPDAVSRLGTRVLVVLLGLGALLNFASSSPWERFGWGPFTVVLFIFGVSLARSGSVLPVPKAS
jgi:hypothetical protein